MRRMEIVLVAQRKIVKDVGQALFVEQKFICLVNKNSLRNI